MQQSVPVAGTGSPARLDPITVEILGNAFASIADEMGEALVRTSYSTNIKERRDCSTALFDAQGQVLCQAEHIPMHLGSFLAMLPHILARYSPETLNPGDVFIGNDAYEGGGTHLPDIVLAEPIFFDGRVVAWAMNTAHHADFIDRGNAHIYQEGLRIPPVRLYRAGELQREVQALILLNCQVPEERLSDLRAQRAANQLGVQRIQSLCARYGADTIVAAGQALQDYAEKKMRAGIARIPDGTYRYTDRFDPFGQDLDLEMSVEIVVEGDAMRLHFDSPPQVRASINVVYTALLAAVYFAVKSLVDPEVLPNSGLARPLAVTAEEGTVLNCKHPAAVNSRINACQRVVDLVYGALAPAIPDRVTAAGNGSCVSAVFSGIRDDGSTWAYLETIGGGMGARQHLDGLDGVHVHMTNTSNLPAESLEQEYPLTLLRYELVDDSGGPGRHRGGMGLRRVYRAERDCRMMVNGSRHKYSPWGLDGGGPGGKGELRFGAGTKPFQGNIGVLKAGDIVEVITPGAGGYGDPRERPRDLVREDLRAGNIDVTTARQVYAYDES
ncbi:methylhydantoinase [Bordetella genomosp. 8]|uniref:Methylhydantoinase n=2 Tax=Bordetella genomosp. 8 TaxID=1416806 RepID=A0A1W6YUI1_9BORD|nr:methylhydantoinase [Bordetella genomosp. 8]